MATRLSFRDASNQSLCDTLRTHNSHTLKLVKMVAEFAQNVSAAQEAFGNQLCKLCEEFHERTSELTNERPSIAQDSLVKAWTCLVDETHLNGQGQAENASFVKKTIAVPLMEISTHKKSQSRKLFAFREAFEKNLADTENASSQKQKNYYEVFQSMSGQQATRQQQTSLLNAHNDYVLQIRASNTLQQGYTTDALPFLLEELEDIHIDLSNTLSTAMESYAFRMQTRAEEQSRRFEGVAKVCKQVDPTLDVHNFLNTLQPMPYLFTKAVVAFCPPAHAASSSITSTIIQTALTENAINTKRSELLKEAAEYSNFLAHDKNVIHDLIAVCQRNLARHQRAQVYETQEELCRKRNEIRMAQVQLQMIRSQIDLLTTKQNGAAQEPCTGPGLSGRDSPSTSSKSSSKPSIRGLWKKAFKSMKPDKEKPDRADRGSTASYNDLSDDLSEGKPRRQSSLKKLRRKDSRESDKGMLGSDDTLESSDNPAPQQEKLDPVFKTLMVAHRTGRAQEIDPVYSLLKCAADLPRQGGKVGGTVHDCCPRGSNGNHSRGSSPSSDPKEDLVTGNRHSRGDSLDFSDIQVTPEPSEAPSPPAQASVIDSSRLRPPSAKRGKGDRKRAAFVQQRSYSCGDLSPTDPPLARAQDKERSSLDVKEPKEAQRAAPRDKERLKLPEVCRPPPSPSSSRDRRSGWVKQKQKSKSFDFSWRSGMWSPIDDTRDKKSTFTFMAESKPIAPKSKLKPPSMFELDSGSSYESTDHGLPDPPRTAIKGPSRIEDKAQVDTKLRSKERRPNPVICQTSVHVDHVNDGSSGKKDRQQWILHERKSHSLDSSFEEHRDHSKDSNESIPCQDTVNGVPRVVDPEATMSYIGMNVRDRRLKLLQQRRSRSLDTYDPKAERRCMETAYWSKPAPLERKKSVSKTSSGTRSGSGSGELSGSGRRLSRSPKNLSSSSSPRELSPREPSSKELSPHSREHSPRDKVLTLAVNERRKAFAGQKSFSCEVQSQQAPVAVHHRKQSEPVVSSIKSKSKGRVLPRLPINEAQLEEHISKVMGSSPSLEPASFPPKDGSLKEISLKTSPQNKGVIERAPEIVKKQAHFQETNDQPVTGEKRKDFAEQKSFSYEVNQYFIVTEKNGDSNKAESAPSAIDKRDYIEENEMQNFHSEHLTEISRNQSGAVPALGYRPTPAEKKAQVCEMTTQTELCLVDERPFADRRKHFAEQKSFSYEVPRYQSPERKPSAHASRPAGEKPQRSSDPIINKMMEAKDLEYCAKRRKSSSAARKIDELSLKAKDERRRRSLQQMVGGTIKEAPSESLATHRDSKPIREEEKDEDESTPGEARRRTFVPEERRRREEVRYEPRETRNLASKEREGRRRAGCEEQEAPDDRVRRNSPAEKKPNTERSRHLEAERRDGKCYEKRGSSASPYAERRSSNDHQRESQHQHRRRSSSGERMKQYSDSRGRTSSKERRKNFAQQKSISCEVGIQPDHARCTEERPPKSKAPRTVKEKRLLMMESKKSHSMDEITFIHHIAEGNAEISMSDVLKHILAYSKELERRHQEENSDKRGPSDSRTYKEGKKKLTKLQSLKQHGRVDEERGPEQHRPTRLEHRGHRAEQMEVTETQSRRRSSPSRSPRSYSKYIEHVSPLPLDGSSLEPSYPGRKQSPTRSPKSPKERLKPSIRELETRCPRAPIPGALDESIEERLGVRDSRGNISPRTTYSAYDNVQFESPFIHKPKESGEVSPKPRPSPGRGSPRSGSGDAERRHSPHSLSGEGGELSLGVRGQRQGSRHRTREDMKEESRRQSPRSKYDDSIDVDELNHPVRNKSRPPKLDMRMKSFSVDDPQLFRPNCRVRYGEHDERGLIKRISEHSIRTVEPADHDVEKWRAKSLSLSKSREPSQSPPTFKTKRKRLNLREKSVSVDTGTSGLFPDQMALSDSRQSSNSGSGDLGCERRRSKVASKEDLGPTGREAMRNTASPVLGTRSKHYVAIYSFNEREKGDLPLRSGAMVSVFDQTDSNWWKGKCGGMVGYFPSTYVRRLNSGELPYKVLTSVEIQNTGSDENGTRLLKDQIVIGVSDPVDDMLVIRTADGVELPCPTKYLAEVTA